MHYKPREIERKWQQFWKENAVYEVSNESNKPKYYVLDMFPYPSGSGLHVGHPLGYIASDIISRYKRLKGFNVLHPMGFDAFGLPAEQYAINHGIHPAKSTADNIQRYKDQLENIGFCYDWSREVRTSDPSYYRWTQWIFIQLYEHFYDIDEGAARPIADLRADFAANGNSGIRAHHTHDDTFTAAEWNQLGAKEQDDILMNYRLAYRKITFVNWCEGLGTVLANDEVKDGRSERGGFPVERKPMLQWSLRITAYAERLLQDMEDLEWSDALKSMQRNWIGKSTGAEIHFKLEDHSESIEIFTTRPDTIYGATFMVLAPEHPLIDKITTSEQRETIESYRNYAAGRSDRERQSETKKVSGAFTGAYAINPVSKRRIPIWIADYVLMDYGSGAIMAVPSDDQRDHAFASHFGLEIIEVIDRSAYPNASMEDKLGVLINSERINGMEIGPAIAAMIEHLENENLGKKRIQYKLRDANYSRQRYWGEPFPIIYDREGTSRAMDINQLPLELPDLNDFKPASGAKSPLARLDHWSVLDDGTTRETDTMPGFAGSSWYFLRYMDPMNDEAFAGEQAIAYWRDVDLYIGGTEHAVGHLLYSRFWHKFLFDLGYVPTNEPFKKLVNQGMIQGRSNFVYRANEQMAEYFFEQKLKGQSGNVQRHYPIAGIFVDFALVEDKIAIELKSASKLNHLIQSTYKRFEEEGWTLLGIPIEASGKYLNNFDLFLSKIADIKNGKKPAPINPNIEPCPLFISKDMIKNEQHVTSLHVDIHLVNDDVLDIAAFVKSNPELQNALFVNNAEGQYICGHAVEKMSKSKYNVINPDEVVDRYGADVFRMYEMFLGPIEQSKPWDTQGIDGVAKFLNRFWSLFFDNDGNFNISDAEPNKEELKILHQTLKKLEEDLNRFSFNTCVSQFMITTNELRKIKCNKKQILSPLVIALAPFAPHASEELWHLMGNGPSIVQADFPVIDETYLVEDEIEYPVSINGKKRTVANFAADMSKEEIEKEVILVEGIQKWIEGKTIRKIIVVPGRMINIVV